MPLGKFTNGYINISFDTNGGGDAPATIKAPKGYLTQILDTLKAEKSGYDFLNWVTTSDKSFIKKEGEQEFISAIEDTTLKAEWLLSIQSDDVSTSEFFDFTRSLNLSSVKKSRISLYKASFKQNWEILHLKPDYFQLIVNEVNTGNQIAICRLNQGWNMISTPVRRWRLSNAVPRGNDVRLTIYKHRGNGTYSKIDDDDMLTVGNGYWVYADFSRESRKYLDYKFVGQFNESEKKLPIGWSFFGPTQFGKAAPKASSETQISFYWDTLASEYIIKNDSDFKVGCAYWLLKIAEEKPKEEE